MSAIRRGFVDFAPTRRPSRSGLGTLARISGLLGIAVVASLMANGGAHATPHELSPYSGFWPRVSAAIYSRASSNEDVVRAARADALANRLDGRGAPIAFGRLLVAAVSGPRPRLDAARGAVLLEQFERQIGAPESFWSAFSLATLQQLAGDDREVATTLERALEHAVADDVPAATVARTTGIMAHAQQAAGMPHRARSTFERLSGDPLEREHAVVHLGVLAITRDGVGAALEIWLSHPAGLTVAVGVIVDEADALWGRHPELSYRLVASAMVRLHAIAVKPSEPGFETAVARLAARARDNAIARGSTTDAAASAPSARQ